MGWTRIHLTENDEFELEQKELNGVINPMMMNVYIAAGSGGDMTGGRLEMQALRDKPGVEHMSTCDHPTHKLGTHDKTLKKQGQDVNETG